MKKALMFLKHMKQTNTPYNFRECELEEAIIELEEAMKPKTCRGCKQSWEPNNQTFHKYFCEYLKIPIHGDFCCNKHEQKT